MQWVDTAGKTKPRFDFHVIFAPFLHSANILFSNNQIQIWIHRFFFLLSLKEYLKNIISWESYHAHPNVILNFYATVRLLYCCSLSYPDGQMGPFWCLNYPPPLFWSQLLPSSITFAVILSIKVLQPHLEFPCFRYISLLVTILNMICSSLHLTILRSLLARFISGVGQNPPLCLGASSRATKTVVKAAGT